MPTRNTKIVCTLGPATAEAARPFPPLVAAWVAVVSVAAGGAVPAEGAVLAERASFAEETSEGAVPAEGIGAAERIRAPAVVAVSSVAGETAEAPSPLEAGERLGDLLRGAVCRHASILHVC